MPDNIPTITVDMDRTCRECGKPGATDGGLCLKCVGDVVLARLRAKKTPPPRKPN